MVTLPKDFVATKYPGYFWNLKEQKLYSIKVTGTLRPLAGPSNPTHFNRFTTAYKVSVNGQHRTLHLDSLQKFKPANSVIPLEQK